MRRFVPVLLLAQGLAGCSTFSHHSSDHGHRSRDRDLEAIGDFNRLYLKAVSDGDAATLSQLTTDDIVTIQPNWKPIEGKAANDRANRLSLQLFKIEEVWTPVETIIDGDLAYQRGMFTETSTPRGGGATHVSRGNYLRIFRHQKDGTWRMTRDMTSSDQPVEAPRARAGRNAS